MATKTILVQRKFCIYSTFLDTTLQAEDERLEGETIEDGIMRVHKQLEQTADRLRKEANPHLYQEGAAVDPSIFKYNGLNVSTAYQSPIKTDFGPLPIISKDTERLKDTIEDMILECKSMEELAALKPSATANGLIPQYMNKLKELSI